MNEKMLSKKAIKDYILKEMKNDERITDDLLFKGKRMTLKCYLILLMLGERHISYGYGKSCLDDIGYHCYFTFPYKGDDDNPGKHEQKVTKEAIEKIEKRLDSMLSDDECYMLSDVISGERENETCSSNRGYSYQMGSHYVTLDLWIFGKSGGVMEFLENNEARTKIMLESID